MTSLLKYEAMCDMQNEEKVHVALHDKVRTLIKYVVIDRHDIPITCHYHPQLTWKHKHFGANDCKMYSYIHQIRKWFVSNPPTMKVELEMSSNASKSHCVVRKKFGSITTCASSKTSSGPLI